GRRAAGSPPPVASRARDGEQRRGHRVVGTVLRVGRLAEPGENRVGGVLEGFQGRDTPVTAFHVLGNASECRAGEVSRGEFQQFRWSGAARGAHGFGPRTRPGPGTAKPQASGGVLLPGTKKRYTSLAVRNSLHRSTPGGDPQAVSAAV